jgi:hypothetical protein
MPRNYERKTCKDTRAGRTSIDDTPVGCGVLLEVEGFGRDRRGAIQGGASALMEQRAKTEKPIELRRNAVQRTKKVVDEVTAASSSTWGANSVLSLDAIGRHLRQTRSYDEFVKILALRAVEILLIQNPGLEVIANLDDGLRRKLSEAALKHAREQVPTEFVPIP